MNKVLHISKYYHPFIGGTEQVARDFVNALKDSSEQKVICFNHEKGNKVDNVDDVEIVRVGCFAKIASQSIGFTYGKQLKKLINEFNPNIVVFHYPNPFVAHYLLKFRKKKKFKLVLYWHLDITKQKVLGKLFNGQNARLINMADKIVATSPNYIDGSPWLSSNREKCVVIPCCVNEDRLKYNDLDLKAADSIKEKYDNKTILFAFGRHVEYKGFEYLIKASSLLDDNYVVLIGGSGPLTNNLKKLANGDDKIHFLGRISDNELKSYLIACDIFCFPSITKNEAFGIALLEAMYYGKPSITFIIPGSGVNYVNLKDVTGLECVNSDYIDYGKELNKLADDKELRKKFGEAARQRVLDNFTFDKFKNNIDKLCDELNA